MNKKTLTWLMENKTLEFKYPDGNSFTVNAKRLSATVEDKRFIECVLSFHVSFDRYEIIDARGLFNLKPEVRGKMFGGKFDPESDVEIEAGLNPDLLDELAKHAENAREAAAYLCDGEPDERFLKTENWFALYVKQIMSLSPELEGSGELKTGYSTTWAGLAGGKDGKEIEPTYPVLDELISFFINENWKFAQVKGKPVLKMDCRGENGKWILYANAREEQEQCLIYSRFPEHVPEGRRHAVAEYLTRANYGMPIGNFEMDMEDGELRFKTSVDFEGEELAQSLIRQLVFANMTMMDQYFSGIVAVINGRSPKEAMDEI